MTGKDVEDVRNGMARMKEMARMKVESVHGGTWEGRYTSLDTFEWDQQKFAKQSQLPPIRQKPGGLGLIPGTVIWLSNGSCSYWRFSLFVPPFFELLHHIMELCQGREGTTTMARMDPLEVVITS